MRRCSMCFISKIEEEFSNKPIGKTHGICKKCRSPYNKKWYTKNKKTHLANVIKNRSKYIRPYQKLVNGLKDQPCADCKQTFPPVCMDFDHVDPKTKTANVAQLVAIGCNKKTLLAEIAKCEIVCSNCHRLRTEKRRLVAVVKSEMAPAS